MKFAVQHTTRYEYESPVIDSFNDAHLCPVSDDFQKCDEFELVITPHVSAVLRRLDFYTNQVHHFEVMIPHSSLEVTAKSHVTTYVDQRDFLSPSNPGELPQLVLDERYYDFLHQSERVALTTPVLHEAAQLGIRGLDVQLQVERIMNFIYGNFEYSPGATQVETPVESILESRLGVCQDFAHVMIALCRASGIPARYVSGYFYVNSTTGSAEIQADDNTASHAWVECYLPGIGWVGYDPTHNRRVNTLYVKVAIGRDYADVRPLAGTYRGASIAKLYVHVYVREISSES